MADRANAAGAALGGRIEKLRRDHDLTIEDLAARADIDCALLKTLLDEVPDVEVSVLGRLAEALGVDLSELLEGVEWVPDGRGGGEYRVAGPDCQSDATTSGV
jgi:transcriptional regulator with XRE-family HTH domain